MKRSALILGFICWAVSASGLAATAQAPMSATQANQTNAEAQSENALITQAQAAQGAKDWPKAESLLIQLTAMDPDHWQYRQALADAQLQQGKYTEAADSYGLALVSAGKVKLTPTIRQAMALMYTSEGNAYLKLKRTDDAIKAYTQAAQLSDKPGLAWFNLCAVQYNMGKTDGALTACDKAIAADPTRADAYFVKGSILMGSSTVDPAGKVVTPAGTVEALKKYLELAPNGVHAADTQQMLDYLNGKN
jgi:tetratricopeptide (TPR) repeat protein